MKRKTHGSNKAMTNRTFRGANLFFKAIAWSITVTTILHSLVASITLKYLFPSINPVLRKRMPGWFRVDLLTCSIPAWLVSVSFLMCYRWTSDSTVMLIMLLFPLFLRRPAGPSVPNIHTNSKAHKANKASSCTDCTDCMLGCKTQTAVRTDPLIKCIKIHFWL